MLNSEQRFLSELTTMSTINVLIIVDKFDYHGSSVNGPARYYSWLVSAIDKTKFHVTLCCLRKPGNSQKIFSDENISVKYLECSKFDPFTFVKIIKAIHETNAHILHLTGYASTTFGRIAALLTRTPTIVHEHWVDPDFSWPLALVEKVLSKVATTRAIAISQYAKRFLIDKKGVAEDNVAVIQNGIPLERFQSTSPESGQRMRARFGLSEQALVVGVIGMFHENKGHRSFIEAVALLKDEFPDAKFVLVGEGELRQELEQQVHSSQLDGHVMFLGEQHDIPAILQMLDVFVMSSLSETAPLSLLEAMAASRAIVTTDCGGPSEVISNGISGYVVPVQDTPALAEGIRITLRDEKKRKEWGEAARKESQRYDIRATVDQVQELYNTVYQRVR